MLNDILKDMNLFVDGFGHAGNVNSLTPPPLTTLTEEFRGGGMDAPIAVDMGMEAMESSFELTSLSAQALGQYGLITDARTLLEFRASAEGEVSAIVKSVIINMQGKITGIDYGTWTPGEKALLTLTMMLEYYKLTIDGVIIHEIDILNMKRLINGVDQLAARRAVLGIA